MSRIDVVITNYQYGRYLKECVDCVLSQNVENLSILIIDNASTDNSQEVSRRLAANDARISLQLNKENLGHHASLNHGIEWTTGDYFMVLCSDDLLAPGCLMRAISVLDHNEDVAFVYGAEVLWREGEPLILDEPPESAFRVLDAPQFIKERSLPAETLISAGALLVRAEAQKRAGGFNSKLRFTDDLEMMLRLTLHGHAAQLSAIQG